MGSHDLKIGHTLFVQNNVLHVNTTIPPLVISNSWGVIFTLYFLNSNPKSCGDK